MAKTSVSSSRASSKRTSCALPEWPPIESPVRPWSKESIIRWVDGVQAWSDAHRRGSLSGLALTLGDGAAQFRHRYLVLLSRNLTVDNDATLIDLEKQILDIARQAALFIADAKNANLAGIQKHAGKNSAKKAKQKHKLILDFIDRHQIKSAASLLSKGRRATPRLIGKINEKEYVVDESGKPIGRPLGDAGLENIWNRLAKQRKKIK